MGNEPAQIRLHSRLIDTLYTEAMLLADEVRAYFERASAEREALLPLDRVVFSCESLKVTTRLMHILSWLLSQRAAEMGQVDTIEARLTKRIGEAADSDPATLHALPDEAIALIEASRDLYARVARLDAAEEPAEPAPSPALHLLSRLERAF
ncbi:DUF1465 family protein [Sphingomonas montanisoli]|uniref:DUF1465 family protein n=1 Tax=Sphingomonas montanisoli TaxID=2606412 RepID=A0A5D9CCC6_9SPHN|nr:DUF1465 family protein [Sphingomonas montanisoli]TZG28670.1 DUF1465 family protein [Sphingomonas montanisoli]